MPAIFLTWDSIAGGFYQNTIGHYGTLAGKTGCLPCPKGTYVELDKFPAKHQHVCRVCPAGKSSVTCP